MMKRLQFHQMTAMRSATPVPLSNPFLCSGVYTDGATSPPRDLRKPTRILLADASIDAVIKRATLLAGILGRAIKVC
jgi:hypothetical protein